MRILLLFCAHRVLFTLRRRQKLGFRGQFFILVGWLVNFLCVTSRGRSTLKLNERLSFRYPHFHGSPPRFLPYHCILFLKERASTCMGSKPHKTCILSWPHPDKIILLSFVYCCNLSKAFPYL